MSRIVTGLVAVVVAFWAFNPVVAEEVTSLPPNTFLAAQASQEYLAKDLLIGAKVRNDEGAIIGDIEDIILTSSNRIVGVVIGTGGFLGIAEKRVGIELGALSFSDADGKTVISLLGVSKAQLKAVPAFERKEPKKSLLERAMEKARELTDKTADTTSEAINSTTKSAAPTLEKAKEAAGKAYEKAKDAAESIYDKAREGAKPAPETNE